MSKAKNRVLDKSYLISRAKACERSGFSVPKWITFSLFFVERGYKVTLYEAKKTVSKYVTIKYKGNEFRVRFSNHKPIEHRELKGDCDFFVGVTHTGVRTASDAWVAATKWMQGIKDGL